VNVNPLETAGTDKRWVCRQGGKPLRLSARDLMPRFIVALFAAGLLLAGCAVDSPIIQAALVMPSTYDPLTCPEVVARFKGADGRAKELKALKDKSGSPIANALAYDTEYATALANRRYAEQAAERKGCDLGNKPPLPPPTAVAAPAPPGPLQLAPPTAAEAGAKKQ